MNSLFHYDKRKKSKIYEQIIEQIITYINDYKVIHGTPLKDIPEIKAELSLAEHDIKLIFSSLEKQGYVVYDKKLSTYRIQKPIKDSDFLIDVAPAYQQILAQGKTPRIENLHIKNFTVDASFAKVSGFVVGEPVVHCQRLFYANDVPSIIIDLYLSLEKMPLVDEFLKKGLPHMQYVLQNHPKAYQFHVRELQVIYTPEIIQKLMKTESKEEQICTKGTYHFFHALGKVSEYGVAYMTDLTDFSTQNTDLTKVII